MLVPNGALRFNPDADPKAQRRRARRPGRPGRGGAQATIGAGSRQDVHVLKADGTLEKIEVITGQSDGRLTAVTSRKLKPGMKVVTGIKAADASEPGREPNPR